jgi:hypothetical protein
MATKREKELLRLLKRAHKLLGQVRMSGKPVTYKWLRQWASYAGAYNGFFKGKR